MAGIGAFITDIDGQESRFPGSKFKAHVAAQIDLIVRINIRSETNRIRPVGEIAARCLITHLSLILRAGLKLILFRNDCQNIGSTGESLDGWQGKGWNGWLREIAEAHKSPHRSAQKRKIGKALI